MTDDQFDRLERAVVEHGNQLGHNLVHLKRFNAAQNERQEELLRELQKTNDAMQKQALKATQFAAGATGAAAIVTAIQVGFSIWR